MNQNPYQSPQANIGTISSQYGSEHETNDSKWYSFSGRIGRLRYLSYPLVMMMVLGLVLGLAGGVAGATGSDTGGIIFMILTFVIAIPATIYGAFIYPIRRLHDLGQTGWLVLVSFVPVVGFLFYLYLIFAPGNAEENEYGEPPRPNKWYHWISVTILPIFIIGVMAAIAVPAYQDYVERAQAAQMQSE